MKTDNEKSISLSKCKARLGWLWLIGFVLIFILLIFQHTLGKYEYKTLIKVDENNWKVKNESNALEAWGLLISYVLPALSLIVGSWKAENFRKIKNRDVSRSLFKLFYSLSLFYLIAITMILLLSPFSRLPQIKLMRQSNVWLLAIQAVVGISLSTFYFIKKESAIKFFKSIVKFFKLKKKKKRRK